MQAPIESGNGLRLSRDHSETLLLEDSFDPDSIEKYWESMLDDPNLRELAHATLVLASRHNPGTTAEAVQGYKSFLIGSAAATRLINNSLQVTPIQ